MDLDNKPKEELYVRRKTYITCLIWVLVPVVIIVACIAYMRIKYPVVEKHCEDIEKIQFYCQQFVEDETTELPMMKENLLKKKPMSDEELKNNYRRVIRACRKPCSKEQTEAGYLLSFKNKQGIVFVTYFKYVTFGRESSYSGYLCTKLNKKKLEDNSTGMIDGHGVLEMVGDGYNDVNFYWIYPKPVKKYLYKLGLRKYYYHPLTTAID